MHSDLFFISSPVMDEKNNWMRWKNKISFFENYTDKILSIVFASFTKLPWLGNCEETFRSPSQAAACPPACHTRWRLYTVPFVAEC